MSGLHRMAAARGAARRRRESSASGSLLNRLFFKTLKNELWGHNAFPTREIARTAIFEYIEASHNRHRLHSSLGNLTPIEYEQIPLKQPREVQMDERTRKTRRDNGRGYVFREQVVFPIPTRIWQSTDPVDNIL